MPGTRAESGAGFDGGLGGAVLALVEGTSSNLEIQRVLWTDSPRRQGWLVWAWVCLQGELQSVSIWEEATPT